jgi:hypothetical protein
MKTNRSLKSFTTFINQKIQYNSNKSQEITLIISLEILPKSPLIFTGNRHWTPRKSRRKTYRKNRVFLSGLRVTGSGSPRSVGFDSRVAGPSSWVNGFLPTGSSEVASPGSPSLSTGRSGQIFPISLPLRSLSLSLTDPPDPLSRSHSLAL